MRKINVLSDSCTQPYFPLSKFGYRLRKILNNANRWHTKLVCNILDRDSKHYVSTTYTRQNDYLRLLETTTYLECNSKISPKIARIYPEDKSIVCDYIGEYLSDYLLNNPANIALSLISVFEYLKDINSISQGKRKFIVPSIVEETFQLIEEFTDDFVFLSKTKTILSQIEDSDIKFIYGCGIEDPHIWNFRILKTQEKIEALTTDFDYFSNSVNHFWELGYFYATFRWFKKISYPIAGKAEEILLSLVKNKDIKSKFMFWLGVLSSYCGYRDSLLNILKEGEIEKLQEQYRAIQRLDEYIYLLANRLLLEEKTSIPIHEYVFQV